jgi:autotransporter strand-loop-strand O-heptosyltransferase
MKILFLAPHLSTGGMPAFLLKRIECLSGIDITVVEYANHSDEYVVQKNRIKSLVPNFHTLQGDKAAQLAKLLKEIDVVHIDEMIEKMSDVAHLVYSKNRTWRIVETCHDVSFDPKSKRYHPDAYAFCTPYHLKTFTDTPSYKEVLEFPIDAKPVSVEERFKARMDLKLDLFKKHVINVGLWTPGKNQKEGLEIAKKYPEIEFHFIGNQAPNFRDYWEPLMQNVPKNVTVWGERSDVSTFMKAADVFMFNSTWECNPLVLREAISYRLPILSRNLPQYENMFTPYIQSLNTYLPNTSAKYTIPIDNTSDIFGKNHYFLYKRVIESPMQEQPIQKINITQHFVNQPFIEITGESSSKYRVSFFDENNVCHYTNVISSNNWVRLNRSYYTKWRTSVWEDEILIHNEVLDLSGKRVYIAFDSSSLGDTIAWIPYALEFKNKHNCHVIVSTFKNFLFKDVYPELEFVDPGITIPNIYAQYNIGWFYDVNKEPTLPNTIPLQQTATNILGLDYQEIKPRIVTPSVKNFYIKYVAIATNSTAGCKFWTKEGWQEVIDYLVSKGYTVINVSKERNEFNNCIQIENTSMEHTIEIINDCEFFIGLSSGLSWLAWALNKNVVMISNFTEPNHEFKCIRITNTTVCHGCWNNPNFKFDKGDWDWCPIHKNTPRHFECHKSITAQQMIDLLPHLFSTVHQ